MGENQRSFREKTKALAEREGNGIAKFFNEEKGEVVEMNIIGIHDADLIQDCVNVIAAGTRFRSLV